jgi:hypothetical protein
MVSDLEVMCMTAGGMCIQREKNKPPEKMPR